MAVNIDVVFPSLIPPKRHPERLKGGGISLNLAYFKRDPSTSLGMTAAYDLEQP
jgi:hypothetical protein